MFFGEQTNALDSKNRVAIPARFRDEVDPERDGEEFYISRGLDGCLYLFTEKEWEQVVQTVRKTQGGGAFGKSASRVFSRFIFSGTQRVSPDKQGRILLPEPLRQHAGIEKEVTFVGVCDKIELWSAERWAQQNEKFEELDDMAESLFEGDV